VARPADGDPQDDLSSLAGAKVVLGVSGGIAAYKAVELCRRLVEAGAHVTPVLTPSTLEFVGAATFSALASSPAVSSLFGGADPIPHTTLGQSADLVVVAPATARLIGSYAAGISGDALTATLLATRAPVLVCPAMHTEMWEHPAVRHNVATLRRRGVLVLDPVAGRLAGGDRGLGRLPEPEVIVREAAKLLSVARGPAPRRDLDGVLVLVTAGGTREPIDPVRFIANRSSGKQGYAIAEAAVARGAQVTLVTTAALDAPPGVTVLDVETAGEMAETVLGRAPQQDVVVMAAAVADFRPKQPASAKLRKTEGVPDVVLEPTMDILAELGRRRGSEGSGPVLVGFAAETEELKSRAFEKLAAKGVDLIVGNDVSAPGVGFAHETNAVTIFGSAGSTEVPLTSKREIADAVLDSVASLLGRTGDRAPEEENT
jgi:phosphopantothenoylcysteine decarboxylase/phosphopantothenate--cysteine ligase